MSRPRHNRPEYEKFLKKIEKTCNEKGEQWRVTGGGAKHFKIWCPNPCKCMTVVSTTPKAGQPLRILKDQMERATCWEDS